MDQEVKVEYNDVVDALLTQIANLSRDNALLQAQLKSYSTDSKVSELQKTNNK